MIDPLPEEASRWLARDRRRQEARERLARRSPPAWLPILAAALAIGAYAWLRGTALPADLRTLLSVLAACAVMTAIELVRLHRRLDAVATLLAGDDVGPGADGDPDRPVAGWPRIPRTPRQGLPTGTAGAADAAGSSAGGTSNL